MAPDLQPDAESTFSMDPIAVLTALSRQLVQGQQTLAEHGRAVADLPSEIYSALPEARILGEQYQRIAKSWLEDMLPTITASMNVALEVLDTFGPGHTTIEDPVDAQIWNNKFFVWQKAFRVDPG